MHLKKDTVLKNGDYRIIGSVGQGGYSITYLALQEGLNREVVVKEFFLRDFCDRVSGTTRVQMGTTGSRATVSALLGKFIKEARCIAKLDHPNIVRVIDVFEENGTAYYVMQHLPGGSLGSIIDRQGAIGERDSLRYIRQVAAALKYMHARNMMHLDIKPDNILINSRGEAVVIDFGISKSYNGEGRAHTETPVGFSRGYAPKEQYNLGGVDEFSPATDIYSLGATLFTLLTGEVPAEAILLDENHSLVYKLESCNVSKHLIFAITKAMSFSKKDRPQSIDEFLSLLNAEGAVSVSRPTQLMPSAAGVKETVPVQPAAAIVENVVPQQKQGDAPDNEAEKFYLYALNASINEDYGEAVKWYRLAAGRGHANAQFNLGNCHYNGNGVDKDMRLALRWWRRAAENGHVQAQMKMGDCMYNGEGAPKNFYEAAKWYLTAAGQECADAQYMYACCCEKGEGVETNIVEAVRWWRKAAKLGHAGSQYKLALCCKSGEGAGKNLAEAINWCEKAAEQGDRAAMKELPVLRKLALAKKKEAAGGGNAQDGSEHTKWIVLIAVIFATIIFSDICDSDYLSAFITLCVGAGVAAVYIYRNSKQ